MQCIELIVAQLIAILRIQNRKIAPFLPSEKSLSKPLPGLCFCTCKGSDFQGYILIGFGHLRDYL